MKKITMVLVISALMPLAASAQQPVPPTAPTAPIPPSRDRVQAGARGAAPMQRMQRMQQMQQMHRMRPQMGQRQMQPMQRMQPQMGHPQMGQPRMGRHQMQPMAPMQGAGRMRGAAHGGDVMDRLPELRQRLNLTDDQVARLREISEKTRAERTEAMQRQRELMEKQRTLMQEDNEKAHKRMMDVLTDDQRKQLEEMRAGGAKRGHVQPAPAPAARRGGGNF